MKKFIPLFCLLLLLGAGNGFAQNGFTQEDRDRIIRTEVKIEEMNKRFEQRFEQMDKRFTELREDMNHRFEQQMNFMWILAGIFTTITGLAISIAMRDRKTIMRPFETKVKEIENNIADFKTDSSKIKNLIAAFRELSKEDPKVAQVLKQFNLF